MSNVNSQEISGLACACRLFAVAAVAAVSTILSLRLDNDTPLHHAVLCFALLYTISPHTRTRRQRQAACPEDW